YENVGGFKLTRLGEDIEYSIRIDKAGYKVGLIPEAIVYHKRRTDFAQFYKQLHFFGRARINIYKHFPSELKLVHFFPAAFVLFIIGTILANLFIPSLASIGNFLLLFYFLFLFLHALATTKSFIVS